MEFKARYQLIGLFTVAVIAAAFAFIYWLNTMGGFGPRKSYEIRFTVPVSGLAVGGAVFFNGIRVGEVTQLALDPANPADITARISIAADAPVRKDTVAGVDYQGLTGSANILLTGGTPKAPALAAGNGQIPVIVADPAKSRSWMANASRVLSSFDNLLERNSGRFDAILSGLERMTGGSGKKTDMPTYDLPTAKDFTPPAKLPGWQLVVGEPTITLALNTDKILKRPSAEEILAYPDAHWTDNLPNLFQTKLIESYENAGYSKNVLRPSEANDPDYRLSVDIRGFHIATDGTAQAVISVVAKLLDRDGKAVAAKPFKVEVPAASSELPAAVAALGKAYVEMATDLIDWTVKTLPLEPPKSHGAPADEQPFDDLPPEPAQ